MSVYLNVGVRGDHPDPVDAVPVGKFHIVDFSLCLVLIGGHFIDVARKSLEKIPYLREKTFRCHPLDFAAQSSRDIIVVHLRWALASSNEFQKILVRVQW